jgi:transposase
MDQPRRLDATIQDLDTARALIASLEEQLAKSQREIAALRHELDILCQRLFGKKSERVDPRQLKLALEQLQNERGLVTEPVEMDSGETPVRSHARRRPTGRRPLPAHLPRRRIEIDIPDDEKTCPCGHARTRIGEDIAEKLEYEPASFVVIETVRPKYACPHCHEGVVEAPAPPQAVEKSLAGEGLLAHVVVSKYVDHLPLHRLEGIFGREGIDLPRSTLCGWVADVATALTPIGEQLRREIVAADYLQTDDTTITVLDDRGGSFKGRIWTYLDPLTHQVVFDATTTHERDGPAAFLAAFRGKLQADAYSGYDGLYQSGRVIEIGCWAHGRRRFVEAFLIDTSAALMVALIQQLYQVEHAAADLVRRLVRHSDRNSLCRYSPRSTPSGRRWRGWSCQNRRSARPSATSRINGRRCSASLTTAGSRSTTTAPRISCASWRSAGRTGSSPAVLRVRAARRCCTPSSRAAN